MPKETAISSPDPITGAVTLDTQAQSRLLNKILEECQGNLLCFDLDSTLIDNRPRNAVIMRDYAASIGEESLASATAEHFPNWSASHSMKLLGLSDNHIETIIESYLTFWEQRFFTSEYCVHDIAIAGAVKFVNAVKAANGIVHYVTGRDEGMRQGTSSSLSKLGFPAPGSDDVQLLMNPTREGSDDEYKRQTLQQIASGIRVLAAFDNEPSHINSYRDIFPDSYCVHLNTDHSMRNVKLLDGIQSIEHFLVDTNSLNQT